MDNTTLTELKNEIKELEEYQKQYEVMRKRSIKILFFYLISIAIAVPLVLFFYESIYIIGPIFFVILILIYIPFFKDLKAFLSLTFKIGKKRPDLNIKNLEKEIENLKNNYKNNYDSNLSIITNGNWEPKYDRLSKLCKDSSITSINDSFSIEKFKILLESLMIEDNIPESVYDSYKSEEKLITFFSKVNAYDKIKQYEHSVEVLTPNFAKLNYNAKNYYSELSKYTAMRGKEKRIAMISDSISKVSGRIGQIEYGKYCAQQLAVAVRMSADEKKTSNWGITGGIASAIAGPAAGLAAAYDTMSKNAEIERENAKNRAYAHELSRSIYSSSFKMSDDEYQLNREKEALKKELERAKSLVTIENIDNDKLLKSIKIKSTKVNIDKDTNELLIEVEMNSSFIPDEAFIGKMVVDGYIEYDVYKADIFVGKTILLLPVYGINCEGREAVPVNGKCDKYLPETTEYKLKNPCGKLWLVEA